MKLARLSYTVVLLIAVGVAVTHSRAPVVDLLLVVAGAVLRIGPATLELVDRRRAARAAATPRAGLGAIDW